MYEYDPANYRLSAIRDSQAPTRRMGLVYGTRDSGGAVDPNCPQALAIFGADAPPPGKLCKVTFPDGSATSLYYNAVGQLVRFENPGGAITDLRYGTGQKLEMVREATAVDAVTAGQAANDQTSNWKVTYQTATGIATGVTAPVPQSAAARPAHTYDRPTAGETRVQVAGFAGPPAAPWSRKVTFDSPGRLLTDTDAAGLTTTTTWNELDQQTSATGPAGLRSTTVFDHLHRPATGYGPAPTGWFNSDGTPTTAHGPTAAEADRAPVTRTNYDEGIVGLRADYYNSLTPGLGNPVASAIAPGNGNFYNRWGSGSPAAGVNIDGWSATMTGTLTLPQAGTYTIGMANGDGGRLWIDGQLKIDDWNTPSGFAWKTPDATVVSAAPNSKHDIRIEVMDVAGEELAQLRLGIGTPTDMPSNLLSPDLGLVTSTTDADGKTTATTTADPIKGTTAAGIVDPGGLRLGTSSATDTSGRRTGKRLRPTPTPGRWPPTARGPTGV